MKPHAHAHAEEWVVERLLDDSYIPAPRWVWI